MKWLWVNSTQVGFGIDAVKENISKWVKPGMKIVCTYGGGSIERNGAKADVTEALAKLKCEVTWEGGIVANPEYDRLVEIAQTVRRIQPDFILAVGGGSTLDGTKFVSLISKLPEGVDYWNEILVKKNYPTEHFNVASVMTLPATGSEWNNNFVISRRSINGKLAGCCDISYPVFSLLDPRYTMTLPERQLRNGLWDAITHCIDQYITPHESPMMDDFWISIVKELVAIGPDLLKPNSSLELHERLIVAATFALNLVFTLCKPTDWSIHTIGHMLTAEYGIDHGATLAIVAPVLLERKFEDRKVLMAKTAEQVFDIREGTVDEKARAFIEKIREYIRTIKQPLKVSEYEFPMTKKIENGDVDKVTNMVMESTDNKPFGVDKLITKDDVHWILERCIL